MNVVTPSQRVDEPAASPILTIFSAPKAFSGHVGIIQENAIRSWLSLKPTPKIILFGDDAATAGFARGLGVQVVTAVETNSHGTPLVSNMFSQADSLAVGDVVAFVSADIILTQRSIEAARIAKQWSPRFLLVAQRHDADIRKLMEFDPGWEERWAADAVAGGKLHSPGAIDWFVYPRGQYEDMPPFAIGRTSYDNWLLWHTVASGVPLIDATSFVTLIHQNHDYSHATVDVWDGEEARENRRWIRHWTNYYRITHATWMLRADGTVARASALKYRLARPKQLVSHALRATRPIRTRLRTWRLTRRYGA
ncbi:MAG TPA: hypothetical protein VGA41_02165 [Candidatus Dormibacteraeota bacterium]